MRHRVLLLPFLAVSAVVAALVPAPSAGAQEQASGLTWSVDATYTVRPEEGRVEVEFVYRFTNTAEAVAFPGFFESLPTDAVDPRGRQAGVDLVVAPTGSADDTTTWFVQFAVPLEPGDDADVTVTWTIESQGLPGPLVVPGAVSFEAFRPAAGDETTGVVRVIAPAGYDSLDGHTPVRSADDAEPTYEAFVAPYDFIPFRFLARELFDGDLVDLPPVAAITSWPNDDAWIRAVRDRATAVADDLDGWFGPLADAFAIRRTLPGPEHPVFARHEAELVGDDATSVDHQLAHVWLADVVVDEPWFIEGLALGFAGQRGELATPEAMTADLVDELGAAGVRAVVDALRAETTPYPGRHPEQRILPANWQTLLDLVERVGGVEAASGFRAVVTSDADDELIDRRAVAVVDYAALEARAGSWALPPFLRRAMATWDFDTFFARQAEVSEVITRRDALEEWAVSLELAPRTDVRELFEAAETDLAEVVEALDRQEESLEAFDEAEAAVNGDRGLLAAVGLWGSDPKGRLRQVRQSWEAGDDAAVVRDAHELTDTIESAVGRGTIRLLVPALAIIGAWQGLRWVRRWISTRAASAESDRADAPDEPDDHAQSVNAPA